MTRLPTRLATLATSVLLVGALVPAVWAQPGPPPNRPGAGMDMARHFIEEMIPHHEDAIVMAELALAQAEHPELRDLARAIITVQQAEIDQMRAWYLAWYGADVPPGMHQTMATAGTGAPGPMAGRGPGAMAGAGQGHGPMMGLGAGMSHGAGMGSGTVPAPAAGMGHGPGMMMPGDPRSIDGADPFDRAFIEEMIPHHQMAVMMSTLALRRVDRPELRALLESIRTSQAAEIDLMRSWYQTWYGTPAP